MKRIVAMLLAVCMILCQLPLPVHAAVGPYAPPETSTGNPLFLPREGEGFLPEGAESGIDMFRWNRQTPGIQSFGTPEPVLQTATEQDTGAELQSDGSLTVLTVSGVDALANPVGDGWSFDAETATLTLAGATITGDEQGYGIYAVGNLNIYLAEGTENTISNIMFAIYVDGSLSISGGQLNILGKTTNCAGIFTIQGFYAQNCTLNVEAELYGIVSNGEMQLESCDIQIHVKVLALAGIGLMNISNCTITAISDVTVDEYIANGYVDPPCALVCMGIMTITQSNITAAGLTAGIMADMGEQNEIHIDNSYVFSEGTFSGIMARSAITITGSEVIVPVTGDPETLLSSFDANIPYSGILVMETGPMTITDSSITIDGGPYALGAQILHIRSSVIDISNCIYGIVGRDDLLIEDCEHVHVSTGTIMGDLVLPLGISIPFAPSAIIPFGCDVIIRNCSDVMADG